jgi:hypothetical protein
MAGAKRKVVQGKILQLACNTRIIIFLRTRRYFDLYTVYCTGQQHLNTKGERFICKYIKNWLI